MDKTNTTIRAAYALAIAFAVALGAQFAIPADHASANVLCMNAKGKVKAMSACTGKYGTEAPAGKGDPGEPGEKGDKGDPGEPGQKGDKGDRGSRGFTGDEGVVGSGRAWGYMPYPNGERAFLAKPARVTINEGEAIFVSSHREFGTAFPSATRLDLGICYQRVGEDYLFLSYEFGPIGIKGEYTMVPMGLSWVITNRCAGTYDVGLCGRQRGGAEYPFNYGSDSMTSAIVFRDPNPPPPPFCHGVKPCPRLPRCD